VAGNETLSEQAGFFKLMKSGARQRLALESSTSSDKK
jgi:hypothetical protein